MRKSKSIVLGLTVMSMVMSMAMPTGVKGPFIGTQTVSAEVTSQGKCGDTAEYQYDNETKTLTISGTGATWDDYGFAKTLTDTKNIVIENGITGIGSYSFEDLNSVESVSIAESVKTIKKNAFEYIKGTLEIPSSVTKVEAKAFAGASKMIVKGDVKGYAVAAFGGNKIDEIILHGSAEDLGKAAYDCSFKSVTLAKENTKCKVGNGCLMSADGKELYYCINERDTIVIPASVETIAPAAFAEMYIGEVVLGKNVNTIGDFAFEYSYINKLTVNKKLANIGVKSFYGSSIKNVTFNGKVALGVAAFSNKVTIKNAKKFKNSQTTVDTADVGTSKYTIKFAKVSGAKGYEIKVKTDKKTYKYTTTKNSYTKSAPKALTKDYTLSKKYYMEDNQYLKNVKGAATVTVRPYQVVKKNKKDKKVYGAWSEEMVLSHK